MDIKDFKDIRDIKEFKDIKDCRAIKDATTLHMLQVEDHTYQLERLTLQEEEVHTSLVVHRDCLMCQRPEPPMYQSQLRELHMFQ